jgi:hypothetical protein
MLLIHQIPPTPAYLRVKIGRHLARIGAVAIKNSVYALPHDDETQEDFQWVLREIVKGGGDGSIPEARFIDGLSDEQVVGLFQTAREADYHELAGEVRTVADVKDAKYRREEAPGIGQLVAGIAAAHPDDEARLARGAAVFDDLYALHRGATRH